MGLNGLLGFKGPTHLMPIQTHPFDTPKPNIPNLITGSINTDLINKITRSIFKPTIKISKQKISCLTSHSPASPFTSEYPPLATNLKHGYISASHLKINIITWWSCIVLFVQIQLLGLSLWPCFWNLSTLKCFMIVIRVLLTSVLRAMVKEAFNASTL